MFYSALYMPVTAFGQRQQLKITPSLSRLFINRGGNPFSDWHWDCGHHALCGDCACLDSNCCLLLSICLNYALIVAAHRKSLKLLKEMGNQQELTQSKVTVDLNKLKPQTLVPAAYGLVLVPPVLLALVLGFQQTSADSWVMILALAVETLTVLGAFYLSRRARGAVRGNPDAEPRAGKVRNSVLYYLLFTGFLSQSLLVLQLMLPNMSAEGQWWFVIITLTLTLLSVSFLPLVYILGTRRLTAKGSVLNDNQHWVWGCLL